MIKLNTFTNIFDIFSAIVIMILAYSVVMDQQQIIQLLQDQNCLKIDVIEQTMGIK